MIKPIDELKETEVQNALDKLTSTVFNWIINLFQEILMLMVLLPYSGILYLIWNFLITPNFEYPLIPLNFIVIYNCLVFLRIVKRALE